MKDTEPLKTTYDAVIVGARCAGAATALLLARAGAKVLLIDRGAYAADTTSTHALMRTAVVQLDRWGLLPAVMAAGTPKVRRSSFHYADAVVPIDIRAEHGVSYLCAPRRNVLDRLLVDAARNAGADVRYGMSLAHLQVGSGGRVSGAMLSDGRSDIEVTSGVVVGADGAGSTVARLAGARTLMQGKNRSGYVYGYFSGMPVDGYHWYFADQVAAGVIPTNEGQQCVFVGVPGHQFHRTFRNDLEGGFCRIAAANCPRLAAQLTRARRHGSLRVFAGRPGHIKQAHGPGWALVGDAGYFKDPLTAHGISDALRDADLLTRAIITGGNRAFGKYQASRDMLSRCFFEVTETIASFSWTMDQLQDHHVRLSEVMKTETDHIVGSRGPDTLAA